MPRIKAIFNPQANRGDNYKQHDLIFDLLRQQAETASLDGLLYQIDWVTTKEPGHATELAYQAALDGYDTVVAIGGDGTIHEVVNGLMRVDPDRRPNLGIVPAGTGNDVTNNFGLSTDLAEAVHCLFQDHTRLLDVGMVSDGGENSQYWVNTLGFGFSGAVTVVARSSTTILRGFMLYLYIVIKTILFYAQNNDIKVQVDDADPVEKSISMVNICNGPAEGGGFPVAPHALMDDGLLSYTFMRRMNRLKMLYFLPIVLAAKHTNKVKHFEFGNAKKLHIESRDPLTVHIDGEMFAKLENDLRQLEVGMIPAALRTLSMS
jgi:diacylglycerol kinase (ATP)